MFKQSAYSSVLNECNTVKPRNSGLLRQPKFFHYHGVFHYFEGGLSRKGHFGHSEVVHYFAGFHYFAVHYLGVLLCLGGYFYLFLIKFPRLCLFIHCA